MHLWIDRKYISLVSSQLNLFQWKSQTEAQFRCPICGDSEHNHTKRRGYLYIYKQKYFYKCFNCNLSLPFSAFLKRISAQLYEDYLLEAYRESTPSPQDAPSVLASPPAAPAIRPDLPSLYDCRSPENALYAVYRFAVDRQIPVSGLQRLFATQTARSWLLPLVGEDKAQKVADGVPYLVQPLRLPDGAWYGAQLRLLTRKEYLTFRWSHDPMKLFGLEALAPTGTVWIVEGPIDSLFLPNAIAPCGSAMLEAIRVAEDAGVLARTRENVYVWDNEPRNKDVRRQIRAAIALRERVVIWPKSFPKDINDMIRAGMTAADVVLTMELRTFQGLQAELEFSQWK